MKAYKFSLLVLVVITLFGLMVFTATSANADLKVNNTVYSWDYVSNSFEPGNISVPWDGGWSPFIYRLDNEFDTDVFVSNTLQTTNFGITNTNTRYSGMMDYAVFHEDTRPPTPGAPGFRTTRRWSLVWCDRDGDSDFDGNDRSILNPVGYYDNNFIENLGIIFQNQLVVCPSGNCYDEVVTRLFVSLDKNNDGAIDAAYRVGGVIGGAVRAVCFYAEAQRPIEASPSWSGNVQARVTGAAGGGGGDQTTNFNITGGSATAVTLSSFGASMPDATVIPMGFAITGVLGLISAVAGLGLWKFKRRV